MFFWKKQSVFLSFRIGFVIILGYEYEYKGDDVVLFRSFDSCIRRYHETNMRTFCDFVDCTPVFMLWTNWCVLAFDFRRGI